MTTENNTPAPRTQPELLKLLAQECVKRVEAQKLTGKKRDVAVMEYMCGAAQVCAIICPEQYNLVAYAFVVATRGYKYVYETATKEVPAPSTEPV